MQVANYKVSVLHIPQQAYYSCVCSVVIVWSYKL